MVSIIRMEDGTWEQSDCLLHQNMKLSSELTDASYFRQTQCCQKSPFEADFVDLHGH